MEVLNDSPSGHSQARRRGDHLALGDRSLRWVDRDDDILLAPVSPLSLTATLQQPGSHIDLLPTPADDGSDAHRAQLRTRHTPDELLNRCRQVLVANALVKRRGQRVLYLAAGFLTWQDEAATTAPHPSTADMPPQIHRAPLLLYPVILTRRVDTDDGGDPVAPAPRYELRLEVPLPDMNLALIELCRQRWSLTLPALSEDTSLEHWFGEVARASAAVDGLSVEPSMALGSSSAPIDSATVAPAVRMPRLPPHFDAPLALAIAGNKSLPELHAVLTLIGDYSGPMAGDQAGNEPAHSAVARLRDYAGLLVAAGVGHVAFPRLPELPDEIERCSNAVRAVLASDTVAGLLAAPDLSSRHLVRLAGSMELLDKAPLELDHYRHPDLAFTGTPVLLRRARHQARLIEEELDALQSWFDLDKVPPKQRLLSLVDELGSVSRRDPELVDADYFRARRAFMEFSHDAPTRLTREHHRLLAQLSRLMRFRELFVNNTEYRLALGPGYRGLRTDWDALEAMTGFAREVAEVLESETLAASALQRWDAFRLQFVADLAELLAAADATRSLLRVVGVQWQHRPAATLLVQAESLVEPLRRLGGQYADVQRHALGTPADTLAQFAGPGSDHSLVELQAGETRQRIDSQLEQGALPREALADTLDWLREASRTATDHSLDIDVIIDQLRIA